MTDTEQLRRFIRQNFLPSEDIAFADDDELFPAVIDPQGVVVLADFIEETYAIRFSKEDLLAYADNFHSLRTVAEFIERKRTETKTDVGH